MGRQLLAAHHWQRLRDVQVSAPLQARFTARSATPGDIMALGDEFVARVADGTYAAHGWPRSMYGVSKVSDRVTIRGWPAHTNNAPTFPSPSPCSSARLHGRTLCTANSRLRRRMQRTASMCYPCAPATAPLPCPATGAIAPQPKAPRRPCGWRCGKWAPATGRAGLARRRRRKGSGTTRP